MTLNQMMQDWKDSGLNPTSINLTVFRVAWRLGSTAASRTAVELPEGWKLSPDENGWAITSPSGDGCFLFDNDRLHGKTMEGAAIREVLRQLVSDLHYQRFATQQVTEVKDNG